MPLVKPGISTLLAVLLAGCAHLDRPGEERAMVERALPAVAERLKRERPDANGISSLFMDYLRAHPKIYGIAFAPAKGGPCPYVYRWSGGFQTVDLALPGYDYAHMDWYTRPKDLRRPVWSNPYYDKGGGNIWMETYSIPLYLENGRFYGVVTSDLPVAVP